MKKIIISVAAATMALSTSVMAIDNVKAQGQAKLIYQVTDRDTTAGVAQQDGLFDKGNAAGQVGIITGISADLSTNLKAAVEVSAVSTLGLENSLVSGTMATNSNITNQNAATQQIRGNAATDDQFWISQAYMTYNAGKTTAKIGIQELNTPLAFTEKWNVTKNTFEAFVLVNNDIEGVTLVGAYVGKSNSVDDNGTVTGGGGQNVNYDGKFNSFYDGAYAVGAITKLGNVNVQAWGYNIQNVADAYWLEADTKVGGLFLGGQYAGTEGKGVNGEDLQAYAVKAATDVAGIHVYGAFSAVSDDTAGGTSVGFSNTATGDKTKLYTGTASIYADGATVAGEDTDAWKIGAKAKLAGVALGASYTDVDYGQNAGNANGEAQTIDFFAAKKVGPVALKAIYTELETKNGAGVVQNDWQTIRFIASTKF